MVDNNINSENLQNISTQINDDNQDQFQSLPLSKSKFNLLISTLQENFYGCDILLCLFIAALQSYRVDRCLRPFPSMYVTNFNKDIGRLREMCQAIPSLEEFLRKPKMYSLEMIELLVWLLCSQDQPSLKKVNYSNIEVPNKIRKSQQPHYIYEIVYSKKTEDAWKKRKGLKNSFLSYHGSKVDNFYSILRVGLQQHFGTRKELLYGNGIYLTSEITVSMNYAPFEYSWENSTLGKKHSIIGLCEVIDDIEKVKCKDSKYKERAMNQGSISGEIPDKYFVVTDSELVRLKYLFVYKENASTMKFWQYNNLTVIFISAYIILLLCIGFFQSAFWLRLQKQILR